MSEERDDLSYSVVAVPEPSALERFARWFHQDWRLTYPDFDEGVRLHVSGLNDVERRELREQLEALLALETLLQRHAADREDVLRYVWLRLGADALPPGEALSGFLRRTLDLL